MGLMRKCLSVTTGGLIDFRSDKERIARSARGTHREMRRQTALMRERNASAFPSTPRHRGEPVSYTDTWSNIDTDLRDAGQRELADRIKRMREQGDA